MMDFRISQAVMAALWRKTAILTEILDAGLDPNIDISEMSRQSKTLLHIAIGSVPKPDKTGPGLIDIVKLLLDRGADPNGRDNYDRTPLLRLASDIRRLPASSAEILQTARLLLERGADVNAVNMEGKTALHYIAEAYAYVKGHEGHSREEQAQQLEDFATLLLEYNADLTKRAGKTPGAYVDANTVLGKMLTTAPRSFSAREDERAASKPAARSPGN